jgi:hypothetical protein
MFGKMMNTNTTPPAPAAAIPSIPAPATPPSVPTEYIPPTQYNAPPTPAGAPAPPAAAQNGGAIPPYLGTPKSDGGVDNGIPVQFTTKNGAMSWISITFLLLTFTTLTYQIIAAHAQIKKHKEEDEKIADLQKRVKDLESSKRG